MKQKTNIITGIIGLLVGIAFFAIPAMLLTNTPYDVVQVPCYDRDGNVINEVTCNDEVYQSEFVETFSYPLNMLVFFGGLLMVVSFLLLSTSVLIEFIGDEE